MSRLVLSPAGAGRLVSFPFSFVYLPHPHASVFQLCPAPTPPGDVPLGLEGTEQKRFCQQTEMGKDGDKCLQGHWETKVFVEARYTVRVRTRVYGA